MLCKCLRQQKEVIYKGLDREVGNAAYKSGARCCSSALCKGVYKSLADELCWMSSHWFGTTFSSTLKRLSLAHTVYDIWRARNLIIFQNDSVAAISIVAAIQKDMQTIVAAWKKIPRSKAKWNLVLEWNLSFNCFEPV
ncbi:hypothetical protein ACH5RR_030129 [Cinchona calisaya]|uniref:Uncharacterized protein n=1 Tax=Cinchona calisaya TaxID=153742 RepID=A0ABD2YUX2_9GENT